MKMNGSLSFVAAVSAAVASGWFTGPLTSTGWAQPDPNWLAHDRTRPQPVVIEPATPSTQEQAGKAPSDATVLFDGKDLSQWAAWTAAPRKWIVKDGYMECVKGSGYVRTLRNFGDCQLHVEWAAPVKAEGSSQGRGNSGVFLMDRYEVQVLDSYDNQTYADGQAGSVYGQYPPLVNACRQPGEWQIYDIIYTAPRFEGDGKLLSPGAPDGFPQRRARAEPCGADRSDRLAGAGPLLGASGETADFAAGSRQSRAFSQPLGARTGQAGQERIHLGRCAAERLYGRL